MNSSLKTIYDVQSDLMYLKNKYYGIYKQDKKKTRDYRYRYILHRARPNA